MLGLRGQTEGASSSTLDQFGGELKAGGTAEKLVLKDGEVAVYFKSCEKMDEIENCSVHLIVTSPPYADAKGTEHWPSYTDYLNFLERVLKECYRVLAKGRVLAWNVCDYMQKGKKYAIPAHSVVMGEKVGFTYCDTLVWKKADGMLTTGSGKRFGCFLNTGFGLHWKPDQVTEDIILFRKGEIDYDDYKYEKKSCILGRDSHHRYRMFEKVKNNVWEIPATTPSRKYRHPLEYPDEIVYYLVLLNSLPNEVVLDPFMGSGTTAKVCAHLNRKCVGYEINPDAPVQATSTYSGDMAVPPTNRELIKWKINQPLNLKDIVRAKDAKLF